MDFLLSKEQEMAKKLFAEFTENEVKPLAIETDETEQFPKETVAKMQKLGFMGIPIPREYGGQGCDPLTYVLCVEELAKACATTSVIVSAHTSLCCDPILTYGTQEQKEKFLKPLASGELLGAFALTEPGAGTDAQGAQTKAVLDGDEWVLNGSKCFITNGKEADIYIVIAVTDIVEDKRGRKKKLFSAQRKRRWVFAAPPPMSLYSRIAGFPRKICSARRARASALRCTRWTAAVSA